VTTGDEDAIRLCAERRGERAEFAALAVLPALGSPKGCARIA
jgi:hypothetical protein